MGFSTDFKRGMGIGGWLTNYKRFNTLPNDKRLDITIGDEEHFQSYITKDDVAYIASLGMDHIRLCFDQIVLERRPYEYCEHIFGIIEAFINWCQDYNLNVVLNLHKAIGNYCDIQEDYHLLDDEALQERFEKLWVYIEQRFAAYPNAAFELLNELRDITPEQSQKWNVLADKVIKSIRAINSDRIIILGSSHWNSAHTLKDLWYYDDENIVYTFHMYAPDEFTHQRGVLRNWELYYNRVMKYPDGIEKYRDYQIVAKGVENPYPQYERIDENFINQELNDVVLFKQAHPNATVWCGEFGTIRHADITSRENYMRDIIRFCKTHEIPYCVWNYLSTPNDGNRFSLVDDDNRKILSDELARIIVGEV